MGSVRPLEKATGTTLKSASNTLTALFSLGRPLVMGILNVTPEFVLRRRSVFRPRCGGRARCRMAAEGADILDVGAEFDPALWRRGAGIV